MLLGQPRLLAAVTLAAVVVGFVAAAPVVFLGSVSSAAVSRQLDPLCKGRLIDPGIEAGGTSGPDTYRVDTEVLARAAADVGGFGPPIASSIGGRLADLTPVTAVAGTASVPVQLGTRTGWEAHVPGGATADDDRIWLPDTAADALGVSAGDDVTLMGTAGDVTLEVGGIFPDVAGTPDDEFWCSLAPQLGSNVFFFVSVEPAAMAVVAEAAYQPLLERLGGRVEWRRWEVPLLERPRTLTEARAAVARMDTLEQVVQADDGVVRRQQPPRQPGVPPATTENLLTAGSRLRYVTARAGAVEEAVRATITPMAAVSALVALGLVAGVGVVWVDRRRGQVRLLWARGVAPGWIGAKAVLECLVPTGVGVAAGGVLALVAATRLGPSPLLEPGTPWRALLVAALGLLAALATVAATVAVVARRGAEVAPRPRRWGWVPWELPVLLAAWWSLSRLRTTGGPVVEGDRLPPVDTLALLFPLLLLLGLAGLAVRLLGLVLAQSRRFGSRWPTAAYLAVRRLAAEGRTVVVLTALLTLSAGVVTYGSGLVRSTEATALAKAGVGLGSEVVARVSAAAPVPDALGGRATVVLSGKDLDYAGEAVDVLGVDPASFAAAAFWDPSFSAEPLHDLLARLEGPDHGAVPALLVGEPAPPSGRLSLKRRPAVGVDVESVGSVAVWPGMRASRPLLVVDQDRLGPLGERVSVEVWARDVDEAELRQALGSSGLAVFYVVSLDRFADTSSFLPTVWTFGFVRVLGAVVGVLALVGLVAYAEARQRARAVAYVMARRMGLTAGGHRRALLVELGVLASVATMVGVAAGWWAVRVVNGLLDAQAERPPAALLRVPWPTLVVLVAAAVLAVVVVAVLAQRTAGRADPAEVLRGEV
jgi:putative ABC transport system permease protein